MLEDLFTSGRIADLALAVLALELVALALIRRRLGRGPSLAALAFNAASGAGLLLALRSALAGWDWTATAAFLTLSLLAHLGDAAIRWRRPEAG